MPGLHLPFSSASLGFVCGTKEEVYQRVKLGIGYVSCVVCNSVIRFEMSKEQYTFRL